MIEKIFNIVIEKEEDEKDYFNVFHLITSLSSIIPSI